MRPRYSIGLARCFCRSPSDVDYAGRRPSAAKARLRFNSVADSGRSPQRRFRPPPGGEVLSQGPVHEAFANPIEMDPKAGPIVKKQPPNPIKEIPPEQQPEGDNIVWIPGYWAWDDDRTDFIWISGVYRRPPGQAWVPGYWSNADDGFQWTPGFWNTTSSRK